MNVMDRMYQRLDFPNVAVIPPAVLPEVTFEFSTRQSYGQPLEPLRIVSSQVVDGTPSHTLLDGFQEHAGLVLLALRHDGEVDVFGHDHVGPQLDVMLSTSTIESVDQPLPSTVFTQKFVSHETREGELMGMIGFIVATAPMTNSSVG